MKTSRLSKCVLFLATFSVGHFLPAQQKVEDVFRWDVKCEVRGCMMFLDVLHGAVDQEVAPDPKDFRQYISLMVAVDRATKKPAYLAFHFPPDADDKQGFFVGFASDEKVNGQWSIKPAPDAPDNLGFDTCDADSCVARLREGKVDDGKGGLIDLLGRFQSADHLWLAYTRNGQPIRTMIPLFGFKEAYKRILTQELSR